MTETDLKAPVIPKGQPQQHQPILAVAIPRDHLTAAHPFRQQPARLETIGQIPVPDQLTILPNPSRDQLPLLKTLGKLGRSPSRIQSLLTGRTPHFCQPLNSNAFPIVARLVIRGLLR